MLCGGRFRVVVVSARHRGQLGPSGVVDRLYMPGDMVPGANEPPVIRIDKVVGVRLRQ